MTEELKLTIFTYKWGKCLKPVGKYLLESLVNKGFYRNKEEQRTVPRSFYKSLLYHYLFK